MRCSDVIDIIEKTYPTEYALSWDNVGLLVGRDDKEIKKIYLAVDATDEVIDDAVQCGADMLITHHPMIFGGMNKINNRNFTGSRVLKLIQNDISYYAMHTNYDVLGMSALAGDKLNLKNAEVLEVTCPGGVPEGIGRVADLEEEVTVREYCELVKEAFGLENVTVFGDLDAKVSRAAVSPGSGKSLISAALSCHADVMVTGDIGHHEGIDAVAQGMAVIDAGHYGIEHIFVEDMKHYIEKEVEGVSVMEAPVRHPFAVV